MVRKGLQHVQMAARGGRQTLPKAGTVGSEHWRRRVVSGDERSRGWSMQAQGGVFISKGAELLDVSFWRWDWEGLVG